MKKYLALFLSTLLVACSSGEQEALEQQGGMPPSAVTLEKPVVGDMKEALTIAGSLSANQSALIRAEIAGIIEKVAVEDGQSVKKGDLLFSIDHRTLEAELKRAEANVSLRKQEYERMLSLFKRKSVSQYDVDKANAELLTAEAEKEYAKAQLSKAKVLAPFDATIGIRQINQGAYVQAGTALIEIVELNPLNLDFSAPETVLSALQVGDDVDVTIPALKNRPIQAQISAIEPLVDAKSRSVKVRARVDNNEGVLRPGLFARVSLPLQTFEQVLWVPEAAVFYQDEKTMIMISDEGKSLRKSVKLAGFENGKAAVIEGLQAEDEIVVAGHHKMPFDGMPIMAVEPTPNKSTVSNK